MKEEQVEALLRKAPEPKTPARLLEELRGDIVLPRASAEREDQFQPRSWIKRWIPALSFAAFLITCVIVTIGVQANTLSELKRGNAALRPVVANLEQLRAENARLKQVQEESRELEQLQKDNADLQRLRQEVAKLKTQVVEVKKLKAENQKLKETNALGLASKGGTNGEGDFFTEGQARADRIQCINHLKQIGLAGRLWAQDNEGKFPSDFISMKNEIGTFKILKCPAEKARGELSWEAVAAGNVTYKMLSPGISENAPDAPNVVFVQCPIHGSICFLDGHVEAFTPESVQKLKLQQVDGRTVRVP